MRRRRLVTMAVVGVMVALGLIAARAHSAQGGVDEQQATAVPLQFPTPTETAGPPTETPTRTPTAQGRPVVEAISEDTNVRAAPEITETNRVGQIQPGEQYSVLGKRFNWYQIEFPASPTGTAWVYADVVTLTGDPGVIPELALEDIPTVDPGFLGQQQTAEAIANTPGAGATLTAQALITPTGIFTAAPEEHTLAPGEHPPTYTYPAYTPTPVAYPRTNPPPVQAGGIPPLVPILALGALGMMGLLVALLRRL